MNHKHSSPAPEAAEALVGVAEVAPAEPVILQDALAEQKDHYHRLAADFDNW